MTSLSLGLGLIQAAGWSHNNATTTFSPASIDGLELWLDVSNATTMTMAGERVSQWSDASGADIHATQETSYRQMRLLSDDYGRYLESSGVGNSNQNAPNYMDLSAGLAGKDVFFVVDYDGETALSFILGSSGVHTPNEGSYIFLHSSGYAISVDGSTGDRGAWSVNGVYQATGGNIGDLEALPHNVPCVHNVAYSGDDPNAGFDTLGAFREAKLGGFGGKFREIISFSRVLTDEQRAQVHGYLIEKWRSNV